MKLSDKPTNWLIIKAFTGSEWDSVDYVLVDISDENWVNTILERIKKAERFKDDNSFYCLSYWTAPDGWYQLPTDNWFDDQEEDQEFDLSALQYGWGFLDITEEELEKLEQPEQRIDTQTLKIHSDGNIQFKGYGKHTSEEFWTEDIPFEKIIEKYQNELAKI